MGGKGGNRHALLMGYIKKKGAWISSENDFLDIVSAKNYEFPDKIQGEPKLNAFLEDNPDLTFLIDHFKELIYQNNN